MNNKSVHGFGETNDFVSDEYGSTLLRRKSLDLQNFILKYFEIE